jgi:hypothetical protein
MDFFIKLLKLKPFDIEEYNNIIKTCDNELFTYTQEAVDKINIIPLFIDDVCICFSFEEIFELLYNVIIDKSMTRIPDPINLNKILSPVNEKIILLIDKLFFQSKMQKALNINKKMYRPVKLSAYVIDSLQNFIRLMNDRETYFQVFYDFIEWYQNLNALDKYSLKNVIVKNEYGYNIKFDEKINQYINPDEDFCIRDFKKILLTIYNTHYIKGKYTPVNE